MAASVPLEAFFSRACELSASVLEIERVGIWLLLEDRTILRCAHLYERSKGHHSSGAVLQVAAFPHYFASLRRRKAVPAEVASAEAWTAELTESYLKPLGITSMLDAGIFVDGELAGVVCHEAVGAAREWTTEDRDFAASIADLAALRLRSAEVRELQSAFLAGTDPEAERTKSAALARLAAGVAHDFRNLLGIFHCHGQILAGTAGLPREVTARGKEIVATAERGIALASELVSFGRPSCRTPVVLDVAATLLGLRGLLETALGPNHILSYTPPLQAVGRVLIEESKFTRLVLNLVVNAREAMPAGGVVHVRLSGVTLKGTAGLIGNFVQLEVIDTGLGMDDATRRHIFEPYFSTKPGGNGLGLAIVRQILDQAGGSVVVESAAGEGSLFRVFLPCIVTGADPVAEVPVPADLAPG